MNEEEQLIKEQFEKLPKSLQEAIEAAPWKSSVNEIVLLNKLSLEKAAIIERETMLIIYGLENPESYVENIMREAEIDGDTALTIAKSVDERIFKPIAEQVEKYSQEKASPVAEASHSNLPMVEEGEVAHDVPHVEEPAETKIEINTPEEDSKPKLQTPNYSYHPGQDPYREPLE